jgi:hypothetical protein
VERCGAAADRLGLHAGHAYTQRLVILMVTIGNRISALAQISH